MNLPNYVWVNVDTELPLGSGITTVYAQMNIGSPHECYGTAYVKREPELPCGWTDLYGDSIDPDSMRILYWLKKK
jgi:hypothetical protein